MLVGLIKVRPWPNISVFFRLTGYKLVNPFYGIRVPVNMLDSRVYISSANQISLRQRVLNAGVWSLAGYGLSSAIRLASSLAMTRLLVPEMFGIMAIASMVLTGLQMFSDVGLKPSIIQSKRGDVPAFLNTVWVTQILRGILLWFFALGVSLLISLASHIKIIPEGSVYANPSLPYVLATLSLTIVVAGFESTKLLQASRSLSVAKVTKIDIVAQIAGLLAMISWVFVDRSVWALVAGGMCSALCRVLLSYTWLPGIQNRWEWERGAFDEIMRFGKWIFLSSALSFFVTNGDRMLLGGMVDANSLGAYVVAFLIFGSIDQILTKIIVDVSFPALSEIVRERPAKLMDSYYRFHLIIGSFTYFCGGFLVRSGHTIIELLYDRRYQQAGWILEILAVALLTLPFRTATQCFLALGIARVYFHLHTIRILTLFLAVPIGFHFWGFEGAVWGIVLSYFSSLPLTIIYAAKYGLFDFRRELFVFPLFIAGLIFAKAFNLAVSLY